MPAERKACGALARFFSMGTRRPAVIRSAVVWGIHCRSAFNFQPPLLRHPGVTSLYVSGGHVMVPNRCALGPYIASLPARLDDLNEISKQSMTGRPDSYTELTHRDNQIHIALGDDPKKVIRRLANRLRQIEPVLKHADTVGSQIERRPYSEYIDEIRATDLAKPKVHGVGVFYNGKFIFHPLNLTTVAKPTEREHVFQVEYGDGSPAIVEIPTAYRESVEDISVARKASRARR
jgi:hypothetical protein